MNYIIEYSIGAAGSTWVQSDAHPDVYPEAVAQEILDSNYLDYRMTPVPKPIKKPYRRHAAVTPLELRGAKAMLESARKYVVAAVNSPPEGMEAYAAFVILTDAKLAVTRQLEVL